MEKMLLREPEIFPSKEVLKNILGEVYSVLEELEKQLTHEKFALKFDWNYYNDGKAWLCKVTYKKKTIFWLSVWEGFLKTGFFFLERHLESVAALEIDEGGFTIEKQLGRLIPIIFKINNKKQFPDLLKMIELKKRLN